MLIGIIVVFKKDSIDETIYIASISSLFDPQSYLLRGEPECLRFVQLNNLNAPPKDVLLNICSLSKLKALALLDSELFPSSNNRMLNKEKDEENIKKLNSLSELTTLYLCISNELCFESIAALTNIRSLTLDYTYYRGYFVSLSVPGSDRLRHLTNLHHLEIKDSRSINERKLDLLQEIPNLESIETVNCSYDLYEIKDVENRVLEFVTGKTLHSRWKENSEWQRQRDPYSYDRWNSLVDLELFLLDQQPI